MTDRFTLGQRWVSDTESELGLGIVESIDARRVVVHYPAADERRTYAAANAPLSRVEYSPGDRVATAAGVSMTIAACVEHDGCLAYTGVDENGREVTAEEHELESAVHFSRPRERLLAGQIDADSAYRLRVETLEHLHAHRTSPALGLLGPRVELLPHQLYVASRVGARHAPRVLLADEVGLGKTIEAGLVLHQQLVDGRASRVLLVVPESLVHQWLVEMLHRFNLHFTIFDASRCEAAGPENPFEDAQLALCSWSFLVEHPEHAAGARECDWDLLVVDEAHRMQWVEGEPSAEYRCVESLAERVPGLLLLTATPEQLGADGHFARLRLLDPHRFHDLAAFRAEEARYRPVSELASDLLGADTARLRAEPGLLERVTGFLGEPLARELAGATDDEHLAGLIDTALGQLLDRHGTGRVLMRNTRAAVGGFPERLLEVYPLDAPEALGELAPDVPLDALLAPETLLGEDWPEHDPRVSWLGGFLADHRSEKVLLICARGETARTLETHLRRRLGVRTAVFHESMSLIARDRAAAYFASDEDGARILICSEIGSEGRNFQFAHHLVLFDLPLDPDQLEQRIGRLDRIGQRHPVRIHVPCYSPGPHAVLARWYHEGLDAFERAYPAGDRLLEAFAAPLAECIRQFDDTHALDALVSRTREHARAVLRSLAEGRDRLLELNAFDPGRAAEVVSAVANGARTRELASYLERLFDLVGIEHERHDAHSLALRPGNHMLCPSVAGLPEDGVTATFDRRQALAREDLQFLTWEHPLVVGLMDLVLEGDFGNTAFASLSQRPLAPGTLLAEACFSLRCPAPRRLRLHRYLGEASVRIVIDGDGNDLGNVLTPARVDRLAQPVSPEAARAIVRRARAPIGVLVDLAERLAEERCKVLVEEAERQVERIAGAETARLEALSAVNPSIRPAEIEASRAGAELLLAHLPATSVRLDALRIMIAT